MPKNIKTQEQPSNLSIFNCHYSFLKIFLQNKMTLLAWAPSFCPIHRSSHDQVNYGIYSRFHWLIYINIRSSLAETFILFGARSSHLHWFSPIVGTSTSSQKAKATSCRKITESGTVIGKEKCGLCNMNEMTSAISAWNWERKETSST